MPLLPFMMVSLIGATLWNGLLLFLGMRLREHWTLVQHYSHQIDVVIVVLIVLALLWFFRSRMASRQSGQSKH
jgi:membrane protein DedA with SNARE-associated domain